MSFYNSLIILSLVVLSGPALMAGIQINPQIEVTDDLRLALQTSRSAAVIDTINVEVDYMVAADHSHELLQDEVDAIVQMFACQGIVINIEISDAIPHVDVIVHDGNGNVFNNFEPDSGFAWIKYFYSDHLGEPGWHYCIMAHLYDRGDGTGSAGLGEVLGDDFIVSLGGAWSLDQIGTPFDRAVTFAHELGHNLGLMHAGDQDQNIVTQYKPNFASIMGYRYALKGVRQAMFCEETSDTCNPFKNLDYSHGLLPSLDESALDESIGIGFGPVDWNCNGVIDLSPVAFDLASFPFQDDGSYQVITDYDDWSNIIDVTFTKHRKALENAAVVSCITYEEYAQGVKVNADLCNEPPASPEPCSYPYIDSDGDGIGDDCDNCPGPAQNDEDGDGICGDVDNCPYTPNPGQEDVNLNGIGDACECTTPRLIYTGEAQDDWFGWRTDNAGDFNGDGYDDIIVGARTNDSYADNSGRVYIYSGRTSAPLLIIDGESAGDELGGSVAGAGDVNLDGYADVIAGAYRSDISGANSGRAYIFYGRPGSKPDTISASQADMFIDGEAANDNFGWEVAGIGDIDGEPGPDVLIGASQQDGNSQGKAYAYSGQTGALIYSYSGEAPYNLFGYSVSRAGDFNNDSYEDFIIGAYAYSIGADYGIGRVYIYSGADGNLMVTITGETDWNFFGGNVSACGDLNNDGFDDVIIGAPLNDSGTPFGGTAYVFHGYNGSFPEELTTASAAMVFNGSADISYLGSSVSYTRDINGDNINELVVGEPAGGSLDVSSLRGRVNIYSGSDGTRLYTVTSETRGDWFGMCVAGTEASTSPYHPDLIVGAYLSDSGGVDAGRVYVFQFGDEDGDGILDNCDNCLGIANADQTNSDSDNLGDACDNCPATDNADQANSDSDSHGDACDNCPFADNEDQADSNSNGVGDACDFICGDASNDGTVNILDITFLIAYLYQDGPAPTSLWAADPNGDGTINILDISFLIAYLYQEGPPPACI